MFDIEPCKHCGRCVMAGPPCCMESVIETCNNLRSEVQWLRKIQSKQHKKILELEKKLS